MKSITLSLITFFASVTVAADPKEYFIDTLVDHFASGGHSAKFSMRYLVNDQYWDPATGPILFYSGNEGDIYSFYENSGFMTETIAQETKGLVVFGEHRYFGVSYPFEPSVAFTPEHNVYLTVEQAMMDFVELIKFIRTDYSMEDKACIVFGGSYGGMLAGWLRMKFPQTFQGALAMSAPILYFQGAPSAPEDAFGEIATQDFRQALEKSPLLIRESFEMMYDMKTREDTWAQLDSIFNTCTPIGSAGDIEYLYQHLSNGYLYMAMTDYPYPANFLEPMPAWPVKESVKPFEDIPLLDHEPTMVEVATEKLISMADRLSLKLSKRTSKINGGMTDREDLLLNALHDSTNVYFNFTGQYPCTNLSDWEGTGSLDGFGWNILACNQLFMPTGFGEDSMFIPLKIDYDAYTANCQKLYGLTPDYQWALDYFGGYNIEKDFLATTNIIWSNGELDPWRAGGLNANVSSDGSAIALYIEGGAHHLDLRSPDPQDPQTVTDARNIEMANIKKWIAEYQN